MCSGSCLSACLFYADRNYVRLKVGAVSDAAAAQTAGEGDRIFSPGSQVELVRHIRDHLISDRYRVRLLRRWRHCTTFPRHGFRKIFKQLYGMPVYQYVKQYRLEQATMELVNGSRPITDCPGCRVFQCQQVWRELPQTLWRDANPVPDAVPKPGAAIIF